MERELGEAVALPDELASSDLALIAIVVDAPGVPWAVFGRLQLAVSLLAGVDALLEQPVPAGLTIARVHDPGLTESMVESVVLHVLGAHRGEIDFRQAQRERRWLALPPRRATERPVGILGLGAIGVEAAKALAELGFPVLGWSRRARAIPGAECFAGLESLPEVLRRSAILESSPLWDYERVVVMPHVAGDAQPPSGSKVVGAAVRRHRDGALPLHRVVPGGLLRLRGQ